MSFIIDSSLLRREYVQNEVADHFAMSFIIYSYCYSGHLLSNLIK